MSERFPIPRVLRDAPDVCVARCCLGMTLYTRHRAPDPASGVAQLLSAFLEHAPRKDLRLFRTSLMPAWSRIAEETLPELTRELAGNAVRPRHLFSFHLADSTDAPQVFFDYHEVDEARGAAGFVQLGLAPQTHGSVLLELARVAAACVPMWCGVGGYSGSRNAQQLATSHAVLHEWSRRYWGLDRQEPERLRLHAHRGLPSVGWLTFLGRDLLDDDTREQVDRARSAYPSIQWISGSQAVIVRAGDEPTLVDAHAMQSGASFGKASTLLQGLLLDDEPTKSWARRFLAPAEWR